MLSELYIELSFLFYIIFNFNQVKPFQCHICLKFLNRRSRLRMHLLAHESCPVENCVLSCKHCKMAFKDAADAEVCLIFIIVFFFQFIFN